MKKLIILIASVFLLSCSAEEETITGNLNIPEFFHGDFIGVHSDYNATIRGTYLRVETNRGLKTITTGENEQTNDVNLYIVELPNDEKLILTKANGLIGISIIDSNNEFIINEPFD